MLILSVILPDQSYSQTENRPLATGADFSVSALLDGKTGKDINTWASDQVPFRTGFFHLDYLIRKAFGQREIKDVFLGKDALLANPEAAKGNTPLDNTGAINQFAQLSGLPCYLLVAPSAALIQSDRLPASAPVRAQQPMLDSIAGAASSATWVDVKTPLEASRADYIYYRTDHHWTTLGAGLGAQSLLGAMGIEMNPEDYDRMQVTDSFEGTLASKTGSLFLNDSIDIAVAKNNPKYVVTWADGSKTASIYDKEALKTKDKYQVFLSSNQSKVRIDTDVDTQRALLLFKDSYANSLIQYLLPYFSTITVIDPRYYYEDLDTILAMDSYTDVAFVYSADTYATISSLRDVLDSWSLLHLDAQHPAEEAQPDVPVEDSQPEAPAEDTQPGTPDEEASSAQPEQ